MELDNNCCAAAGEGSWSVEATEDLGGASIIDFNKVITDVIIVIIIKNIKVDKCQVDSLSIC